MPRRTRRGSSPASTPPGLATERGFCLGKRTAGAASGFFISKQENWNRLREPKGCSPRAGHRMRSRSSRWSSRPGSFAFLILRKAEWRPLADSAAGYPKWSRDGKYIYGDAGPVSVIQAVRIEVATGHLEEIARADFKPIGVLTIGAWLGWTEDWEPLTVRDLSSTQVYRIDLDR